MPTLTRRSNQKQDSPSLVWSSLQHLLENAVPHVLIILDCCYAATAARDTAEGTTKELLAACSRENLTLGVGQRSFTSALIEELQAFGNSPFTAAMLHSRLITMRGRLAFTPIYALLSERGGNSIELAPLPAVSTPTPPQNSISSSESASTIDHMDTSVQEGSSVTTDTPPSSKSSLGPLSQARVLLAVSVVREAECDLEQWVAWLTSQAPWDVTRVEVQVEGIYKSHSTMVLVSVPIFAWDRLPDRAAYRFVGFIKSENLLRRSSVCPPSHLIASIDGESSGVLGPKVTLKRKIRSLPGSPKTVRPKLSHFGLHSLTPNIISESDEMTEQRSQSTHASTDSVTDPRVPRTNSVAPADYSTPASQKLIVPNKPIDVPTSFKQVDSSLSREALLVEHLTEEASEDLPFGFITETSCSKTKHDTFPEKHERFMHDECESPEVDRVSPHIPPSEETPNPDSVSHSSSPHGSPWTLQDDTYLLAARQKSMNWAPIAAQYFPTKTANACRKRHERLTAKYTATGDWKSTKDDALAQSYMGLREEMWEMLAAKLNEKWEIIEKKVINLLRSSTGFEFLMKVVIVYGKGSRISQKPCPHRESEAQTPRRI